MSRKIFVHRPFARESAPEVVKNNNLVKKNFVFSFDHDAEMLPGDPRPVAQLVEHRVVVSSTPAGPTLRVFK